jgi:hypothetical protein
VYELATTKPHERRPRGYSTVEWPVYCEGYYMALCVTAKALQFAARLYAGRRRDRRRAMKDARAKVEVA